MYKITKNQLYNFQHTPMAILEVRDSYIHCYVFSCLRNYSKYTFQGYWKVLCHGFLDGQIIDVNKAVSTLTELLNIVEKTIDIRLKQILWHVPYKFLQFTNVNYDMLVQNNITSKHLSKIKDNSFYNSKICKGYLLLDTTFSNYHVDNTEYVNPVGLYAKTLSINANLTLVKTVYIKTIYQLLDYFSLDMVFASNLLLYLPYLFYNKGSNNFDVFVDVDQCTSRIIIFNKHAVAHYQQLNFGINIIIATMAKVLKIQPEVLHEIHLTDDSFFQLKGKDVILEYNNNVYTILYNDFYKALEEAVMHFFTNINKELIAVGYQDVKTINYIGECNGLPINDIFVNKFKANNVLQKILKVENDNSKVRVTPECIASIGLMNYMLPQIKYTNKLNIFHKKIEQLIMGDER